MGEYLLENDDATANSIVKGILNSHLKNPGKLLRPKLTRLFADMFNLSDSRTHSICWASELIHNASLIHDDVVDSAFMRRDLPTLNSQLPNSKAVLAGDYLLASVIAELVRKGEYAILKTLAETLEEIVEGEFEQDALKHKDAIQQIDLESVALKKTGALIAWNCHSVASCVELSQESQEICRNIGLKLGLAFQMVDDNLDYSHLSGKEYAKDLKEGLINFTTLNLIRLYPELYYSVYQVRGSNFENPPWTEAQISHSMKEVSQSVDHLFLDIHNLLKQLIDLENISSQDQNYLNLLNFLYHVQKRQR